MSKIFEENSKINQNITKKYNAAIADSVRVTGEKDLEGVKRVLNNDKKGLQINNQNDKKGIISNNCDSLFDEEVSEGLAYQRTMCYQEACWSKGIDEGLKDIVLDKNKVVDGENGMKDFPETEKCINEMQEEIRQKYLKKNPKIVSKNSPFCERVRSIEYLMSPECGRSALNKGNFNAFIDPTGLRVNPAKRQVGMGNKRIQYK